MTARIFRGLPSRAPRRPSPKDNLRMARAMSAKAGALDVLKIEKSTTIFVSLLLVLCWRTQVDSRQKLQCSALPR